jgi:hypothetical protein
MVAAAITLTLVAFDALALDDVQVTKEDLQGKGKNKGEKRKSQLLQEGAWSCRPKHARLSAK